jgi:hypothetical protein
MNNTVQETFLASDKVILQDSGLIYLRIQPIMYKKNIGDPIWQDSNFTSDFETTLAIPISVISEFDANREIMQEQTQNLQYLFNKLQLQQAADQKTDIGRNEGLAWWILAFASLDIAVALFPYTTDKKKEAEKEESETHKRESKIFEQLKDDGTII